MRRAHGRDFHRAAGIVRCAGDDHFLRACVSTGELFMQVRPILPGRRIDMLGEDVQVVIRTQRLAPQVCGQGESAASRLRGGGGGGVPLLIPDVRQCAVVEHGRVVAARQRLLRDQHGNAVDLLRGICGVVAIRVGHRHHAVRGVGDGLPGGYGDALAAVLQGQLVGRMRIGARLLHAREEQDAGRMDVQHGAGARTPQVRVL